MALWRVLYAFVALQYITLKLFTKEDFLLKGVVEENTETFKRHLKFADFYLVCYLVLLNGLLCVAVAMVYHHYCCLLAILSGQLRPLPWVRRVVFGDYGA